MTIGVHPGTRPLSVSCWCVIPPVAAPFFISYVACRRKTIKPSTTVFTMQSRASWASRGKQKARGQYLKVDRGPHGAVIQLTRWILRITAFLSRVTQILRFKGWHSSSLGRQTLWCASLWVFPSTWLIQSALVEHLPVSASADQPIQTRRTNAKSMLLSLATLVPLGLVLLIFVGYFAVYVGYARNLFAFPFDYDQGEGFELYDALRLARGENIYLDNAQFPFYASNYPPVYRVLLVPFVQIFGPKLYVGRVVTFACSLLIGIVIFFAARRTWASEQVSRGAGAGERSPLPQFSFAPLLISLVAALAFFAANYVYHIGPLARAHLPMVMFAIAGIYCLDRAFGGASNVKRQWAFAGIGIALLMTAGFTKLQAVDALVAGFGYLLVRKPRWCVIAQVVCLMATVAIVMFMNAATQGQFWLNVVAANVNEYDINITWQTYAQWFRLQGVLIVCSVIYVIWDIVAAIRARSFRPITIWAMYFVAGSALGLLTGKWGAGPSYLIAAIAASCVCTVGLLGRIGKWQVASGALQIANSQLPIAALLAAGLFFWQSTLNVHLPTNGRLFTPIAKVLGVANAPSSYPPYSYYDSIGYTQLGHFVLPEDTANGWAMVRAIQQLDGPVWCEEAMLTLWAGKDVVTNPTQLLNLSKSGMLDTTNMIEAIEQRKFAGVIFRAMFYPEDVKAAIVRNYYWAAKWQMNGFDYWLLLPNPKN